MDADGRAATGFYCSTSGTYFSDKESLQEHYKSDFHRYNLKRKVAGLPPVTREWFEARKAQLVSTAAATTTAPVTRVWMDPLTKKKFMSENTYNSFVSSKKYQDLVRKSGVPAPAPVVITKKEQENPQGQAAATAGTAPAPTPASAKKTAGYKVVGRGLPAKQEGMQVDGDEEEEEEEDDSGWETASTDTDMQAVVEADADGIANADGQAEEEWEEWDVCVSLFDGHRSPTFQANLEYMLKKYGFYLPDAQYLRDPEGLLKYLGQKLRYGRVPLYVSGEDANGKQFRSLHAVQRHMVDTNQCKMLYDGNEDEYAEFYDYDMGEEGEDSEQALVALSGVVGGPTGGVAGYELVVGGDGSVGGSGKIIGTRELARYYKQRPRPMDERQSVVVNTMLARYRALGAPTNTDETRDAATKKEATRYAREGEASRLKMGLIKSVLKKLPKNCPY